MAENETLEMNESDLEELARLIREGFTSGRVSLGIPNFFKSSSSHFVSLILKIIVREALPISVAWTAPPVSFHISQLSTVPKQTLPFLTLNWVPESSTIAYMIIGFT